MLFMDILVGLCLSIVVGFSARDRIICPGLKLWIASLSSSTAGLIFFSFRWFTPLWFSVAASNLMLLLGYSFLWIGFRMYSGKYDSYDKYVFIIPIVVMIIQLLLTVQQSGDIIIRSNIFSLAMVILILLTMHDALVNRKSMETGRLLFIFSLIFSLLSTIIRVIYMNKENIHIDIITNTISSVFLMASSGVSLVWTAASIMLISSQWLQQRLYSNATYDALTGIYNRYALHDLTKTIKLDKNNSIFPNSSPKCDTLQFKRLASFLQKPWLAA